MLRKERFGTCTHRGMKYATVTPIHIVSFLLAAILLAANAHAQGPVDDAVEHIGIGAGVSHYNPTNDNDSTISIRRSVL